MVEEGDWRLVQRCRDGERSAFAELVTRFEKPVYNVALRMLRSREDARDVAQTVFMKVFEHLDSYDPQHRLYSWIYRIAVNESIDMLASRRPHAALGDDDPDESPGPEDAVGAAQVGERIQVALMTLRPEYRAVVVLRHFVGCSYEDIAGILALPEKTVKSRLFTARQMLRDALLQRGLADHG